MTHFAAVAPLAIHKALDEVGVLGSYQLLIASEILKEPEAHSTFWLTRQADQYIIVDNGVIETGFPLQTGDLVRAARLVGANAIVLPDVIDDAKMTIKLSRKAAREYAEVEESSRELIGVVQGRDPDECIACGIALLEDVGVDRLAIPRGLTKSLGTREPLIAYFAETYHCLMHLLGFSDNIEDDMASARSNKLVVGMDAATPVWMGLQGQELPVDPPRDSTGYGSRPPYFWTVKDMSVYDRGAVMDNLERVREWLSAPDDGSSHQSK